MAATFGQPEVDLGSLMILLCVGARRYEVFWGSGIGGRVGVLLTGCRFELD